MSTPRSRRSTGLIAAACALLIVATGCTAPPIVEEQTPPPVVDASELPLTAWERAQPGDVAEGGEVGIGVDALPSNFNPARICPCDAAGLRVLDPTAGGPFVLDEQGEAVLDEDYALSAEVTGADPLVVELHLNPDAVWEDGTPLTAGDYVATWSALNGSDAAYRPASSAGYDAVRQMTVGDDAHHLIATFARPFTDWPLLFRFVLPERVAQDPAAFNAGFASTPLPSNGPFVVTEIEDGEGVVLDRNPLWWGDVPVLERIRFQVVRDDERAAWYASGELDVMDVASDEAVAASAMADDDVRVQRSRGDDVVLLTIRAGDGPLAEPGVRRALALMLDRQALAEIGLAEGVAVSAVGDHLLVPGEAGYTDRAPATDPEAAEAALEVAGFSAEGGEWARDGEVLRLTLGVRSGAASDRARAEGVRDQLAAEGIAVDIVELSRLVPFDEDDDIAGVDMLLSTWHRPPFPLASLRSLYAPLYSGSNLTQMSAPELGSLWDALDAEADPETRARDAEAVDEILWQELPAVPMVAPPRVEAVSAGLRNLGAAAYESVDWTSVGWAEQ
ncbi:ABC transporter family substrate-binding protein [Microbacterium sp. LRZ72]|uniref:ABC transporter family substrate-binding protein n=1 Tax=Microbacterium sp. LRZ72 TaxID=2942481 RepID=UPI0029A7FA29|nr:ABC transporter family substrate-binding protein [Microbacterium sp. LRZ72]MDX2375766.1 ABC transporter family substrate-binding protein [Microbacterium sp. LRZ72]